MTPSKNWTVKEIEFLRNGFLRNISIKTLAKDLNRSPTALNKALSRFKIRQKMRTSRIAFPKNTNLKRASKRAKILNSDSQPASFEFVISYLEKQGYAIQQKAIQVAPRNVLRQCFINQHPVSRARILVVANGIRLDARQPIFFVEHLSLPKTKM